MTGPVADIVTARALWVESVLRQALADGFRGWVEIDDPFEVTSAVERDVWRHNEMPTRTTRQRSVFYWLGEDRLHEAPDGR